MSRGAEVVHEIAWVVEHYWLPKDYRVVEVHVGKSDWNSIVDYLLELTRYVPVHSSSGSGEETIFLKGVPVVKTDTEKIRFVVEKVS